MKYIPHTGEVNDVIGVYIHNQSNVVYKPYAIRVARPIMSEPVINEAGVSPALVPIRTPATAEFVVNSWDAIFPVVYNFAGDIANEEFLVDDLEVTWVTEALCDLKKWADP